MGRGVAVAGGVALPYGADIDTEEVGVADERFGACHVFLQFTQAVGVEFQVVHQLDVILPHEVGLVAEVGVEEQIVRILHDDVLQPGAGGNLIVVLQVEAGVDGGDVHDAVEPLVAFVGGIGEVLAPAEQDECISFSQHSGHDFGHSVVGVLGGLANDDIAEVHDVGVGVGHGQLVEVAAYLVGRIGAARVVLGSPVFAHTHHHQCVFRYFGHARLGGVGLDAVTQFHDILAGKEPQHVGLNG